MASGAGRAEATRCFLPDSCRASGITGAASRTVTAFELATGVAERGRGAGSDMDAVVGKVVVTSSTKRDVTRHLIRRENAWLVTSGAQRKRDPGHVHE